MYIIVKENGMAKRVVNTTTSSAITIDELGTGSAAKYVVAAYYGEDVKGARKQIAIDKFNTYSEAQHLLTQISDCITNGERSCVVNSKK
ncbi:MAG: hypothetical protein PUA84_06350 [Oscillospiraceae bacterium]|nr:hypothetical protein [Oscillospiraceae bacterium]